MSASVGGMAAPRFDGNCFSSLVITVHVTDCFYKIVVDRIGRSRTKDNKKPLKIRGFFVFPGADVSRIACIIY